MKFFRKILGFLIGGNVISENTEDHEHIKCICASCESEILPGDQVAFANWDYLPERPYTHLSETCCNTKFLTLISHYCGVWNGWRLQSLKELHPNMFPEAVSSVLNFQINRSKGNDGEPLNVNPVNDWKEDFGIGRAVERAA